MMEEFVQWLNCYLLLSTTCDEMIEFWMKISLEQHNSFKFMIPQNLQGITYNGELTLSVGDTIPQFTISVEQEN